MKIKERYELFVKHFSKKQPDASTELNYTNAYELLIAVILSAQCTDKRINEVTPALFDRFPNTEQLASADLDEVFEYIRSVSYPRNKAKYLIGMANMLINNFNNEIPSDVDELQELPGVGRKTANVIASVIYNKPTMAVDTHVFRVANRLGLTTNAKNPLASEIQLIKHLPEEVVHLAHHWLILHGRYICTARKPKCETCDITNMCKYFEKLEE